MRRLLGCRRRRRGGTFWRTSRRRSSSSRTCGNGWRCLRRGWCGDRTGRCWFLLRKFGNFQFHRAIDWDAGNSFVLVHPGIRCQILFVFLSQGFESFHALFRARLFVITATRRRTDYGENDYSEQNEEKHNAQPCGKWGRRVGNFSK